MPTPAQTLTPTNAKTSLSPPKMGRIAAKQSDPSTLAPRWNVDDAVATSAPQAKRNAAVKLLKSIASAKLGMVAAAVCRSTGLRHVVAGRWDRGSSSAGGWRATLSSLQSLDPCLVSPSAVLFNFASSAARFTRLLGRRRATADKRRVYSW